MKLNRKKTISNIFYLLGFLVLFFTLIFLISKKFDIMFKDYDPADVYAPFIGFFLIGLIIIKLAYEIDKKIRFDKYVKLISAKNIIPIYDIAEKLKLNKNLVRKEIQKLIEQKLIQYTYSAEHDQIIFGSNNSDRCNNCGAPINKKFKICEYCGLPINKSTDTLIEN